MFYNIGKMECLFVSLHGKEVAANDEFIEEFDYEDNTDDPPE